MSERDERQRQIIEAFVADPVLCHNVLFERRHPQSTPPFHKEMIRDWWSTIEAIGDEAFRGGAKSTTAEDALTAMACLRVFKFALIVGNSQASAIDRLNSIKHELTTNERILDLFDDQQGDVWNEAEILLKNGVMLKAFGARQSMRGAKHWDQRPDMLFVDDLEDEENIATREAREKLKTWFFRSLLQACEPTARKRVVGTPLHPESLLETLRKQSGWLFRVYPIVTPAVSEPQHWQTSNWPSRYPLERIKLIRDDFAHVGDLQGFTQEYLCQSEEQALKTFQPRHYQTAPEIPAWAPSMIMVDPSRTTRIGHSARTGYVAFSWIGAKCFVRAAYGCYHQPNEIIAETFKLDRTFQPVRVGVEKDGLEEFLMQPYRSEMLKTGQPLPLYPLNAPRDRNKARFISGLQVFFEAKDILMCGDFPDLRDEMNGFPRGLVDVLNALAYAPQMRGGKAVYEDFSLGHVAPELQPSPSQPIWLAVSSRPGHTAAALVQFINGAIRVYADWVKEGSATDAMETIVPEARLVAGRQVGLFAPMAQFDLYNNTGLPAAATRFGLKFVKGPMDSIGSLKPFLQQQRQHQPAFMVCRSARWTVNALALGYSYGLEKTGLLSNFPVEGYYRTLMEGLESLASWLTMQAGQEDTAAQNYSYTREGRRYLSSRPGMQDGRAQLKR